LIGLEYILSERLFKTLPEEEKKYWHSHSYEVSSGTLIAPGVPSFAEKADMQNLANTYGKTFRMWQVMVSNDDQALFSFALLLRSLVEFLYKLQCFFQHK
jgi:hypothetical protein